MNQETLTFAGKAYDKMKRYGWEVLNELPEFKLIQKEELNIDSTYQRSTRVVKIKQMRQQWDWIACGALIVFEAESGKKYVVDGQHRLAASMSISEIRKLPCLVWHTENKASGFAASEFIISNQMKTGLKATELFKARVTAGDVVAKHVQELIEGSGYIINADSQSSGNTVKCIGSVYKHMANNEAMLRKVWSVCLAIHATSLEKKESIDHRILDGLMMLEPCLVKAGSSVLNKDVEEKLIIAGKIGCLRSIAQECSQYIKGGERAYAQGLLNIINFKKKNKLSLK